jgi:two-component system response regulator DesR
MLRVLIAEDQHIVRSALVALLSMEDDLEVVAEVDRGDRVVAAALASAPDVALLDLDMPGLDGIAAATELHRALPSCATLVLTALGQPGHVRRALEHQVGGFVRKDAENQDLVDAIRDVALGKRVVDVQLVAEALSAGSSPLTARETEVLAAAARGLDTDEIAEAVALTPATVRNYLSTVMTKLAARNRVDAVRIAREAGWLDPS